MIAKNLLIELRLKACLSNAVSYVTIGTFVGLILGIPVFYCVDIHYMQMTMAYFGSVLLIAVLNFIINYYVIWRGLSESEARDIIRENRISCLGLIK